MRIPDVDRGGANLRAFREQTLYRLLIRARRAENDEMVRRIRERGYPDLQLTYPALLANLDTGSATITALARKAGITRQAASQQINDIARHGYVVVEPHPSDSRAVLVSRTERGRQLLKDALEVVGQLEAEYQAVLGDRKFSAMKRSLATLLDHIDPGGRLDIQND